MTARLGKSALLVNIGWRLRCRSEKGARLVFAIERFHRDSTTDLCRLALRRLDRDRFPNRRDWDGLSNLWGGFRTRRIYACRVARRLHLAHTARAVGLVSFSNFCRLLGR